MLLGPGNKNSPVFAFLNLVAVREYAADTLLLFSRILDYFHDIPTHYSACRSSRRAKTTALEARILLTKKE